MRLSTIFYLYRVRLRARLVQEALAVAGIAVGVALLFASQVADTSLAGSVTRLTNGLVGKSRLQVTARDPHGFSEQLLTDVQQLPGVLAAAPVLQRSVNVIGSTRGESVDLIGVDSRFVSLGGQLLARVSPAQLSKQQGLALPAPVARHIGVGPLQPLLFQVGDRSIRTLVAFVLQASDIGELVDSPVAIAPLGLAQSLAGMRGSINRILVEPGPGHDREVEQGLHRLVGERLDVRPADFEATVFSQAEGPTTQSTELFSAISALVGFLFAFNAMLLTVPQRRNLISDLRLDGYPPLEIVEVMLFDALVLGLVGSAIGLLLGDLLSHGLLQANPGYLSFAFPVGSLRIVSWQSVVLATAGGLLAAVVGVIVPLRREIFAHQAPAAPRSTGSARMRVAGLLLGGMVGLSLTSAILLAGITSVQIAVAAFVSLVLSLLLILPVAFSGLVALFDLAQRPVMGVSPRIAVIELQSSSTHARSLAIAATGAIAVFGSVAIEGARQNLQKGLDRVSNEVTRVTNIWVSPAGKSNTIATTPFENRVAGTLKSLPGVARVSVYRGGFLDVGDRRTLVIAPPRDTTHLIPPNQIVKGDLGYATRLLRMGGWATLSQALASDHHVQIGQRFTLPTSRPTAFRLAAITTNFGWPPGAVILNAEDYARAWGSTDPSAYEVQVKPGVPTATVQRAVEHALGPRAPLMVQSAYQREQVYRSTQRQGLSRLSEIAALVLMAAVLAMAAAMGAMVWQRRPRLAGMKVDGFDQGELWRALLCESALLLGAGCSIGAVFGLYGQLLLSHALVSVTGFPVVFAVGVPIAIGIFAIVTAIAVAIAALPGYLATQVKPALQD
ncbi:MAG TPA: FtsX-like permease family protein [Solirubrobacteraceae bacterium]|nr:FtsX-like permease family protein [Solirubrobacteraceae bacterium]